MTVKEYITKRCSLENFEEISDYSNYWFAAYEFYFKNKDRDVLSLSKKEMNWLNRITRGLQDKSVDTF